jgi:hypothetical protein
MNLATSTQLKLSIVEKYLKFFDGASWKIRRALVYRRFAGTGSRTVRHENGLPAFWTPANLKGSSAAVGLPALQST